MRPLGSRLPACTHGFRVPMVVIGHTAVGTAALSYPPPETPRVFATVRIKGY